MRWKISSNQGRQYVTVYTPIETRYLVSDPPSCFQTLEAVMMDMDGSSTDTEKLVLEAMRQMMREVLGKSDFRFAREDFPHIIGDSTTNHVKYLVKTYNLDPAQLDQCIDTYYQRYHQTLYDIRDGKIGDILIEPMPGLKEFLTTLRQRGVKIGLVTSSLKEEADIVMPEVFKGMGLDPDYESFYDGVIAADEVGEAFLKPHPNLYIRMAEEKLNVRNRRNCFVVEDSTAGIIAARVAGFAVAAVPHPGTRDHSLELANLGIMKRGLPEILERNLFLE
ncbi:MAG: HAD family phosphatase [Candidatus Latescibacteria bacterium]|nr:HAD family phosphatase [Candidatus Latescibacterota bacterium]